jgi:hypothetical protein
MQSTHWKNLIIFLILLALALAFYYSTLNNFFLSDDFDWLYTVSHKQQNLVDIFTTNNIGTRAGNSYRPLVSLVFYIGYNLWHLNPWGYHLISIIVLAATAFLIFLMVQKLWWPEKKWLIAFLASLFFLVLPNHSEVVIWSSSYPDLFATFFYLLSFYFYISFAGQKKSWKFVLSLIFFVLAILAKEIALSLPFLIIVYELFRAEKSYFSARLKNLVSRLIDIFWYFIFLILFFLARYLTTGYLFGYYGREKIILNKIQIFKNAINSLVDMLIVGDQRVIVNQFLFEQRWLVVAGFLLLVFSLWLLLKRTRKQILFLYISFILTILPVINVSMSQFNDEGERYFYLPSAVFCIFLALILASFWQKYWRFVFIILVIDCLLYYSFVLWNKNKNWQEAGQVSQKIIKDFGRIVDLNKTHEAVVFVGLPEIYEGAQVMRNALNYALEFYYPDFKYRYYFLPIYVQLNHENKDEKLLDWQITNKGFFAQAVDNKYIVSGFAARRDNNFYYELRGYDYNKLMSNSIWLEVLPGFWQENNDQEVLWLIFNEGKLKQMFD